MRQITKKHVHFATGFFRLYVMQSVADIVNYVWTVAYFRFPRFGIMPISLMKPPFSNVLLFLMTHHLYFLFITHTAIALNRYTAFVYPTWHQRLWKGKLFKAVILVTLLVPLPCAGLRFAYTTSVSSGATPSIVVGRSWASAVGNFLAVDYSLTTSFITLFLELRAVVAYRKFSPAMRIKHRKEYRLLVYALLQFIGQLLWSAFSFSNFLVYATGDPRYASPLGGPETHSLIVDIICLSGPLCLFSTSNLLRRQYKQFYCVHRATVTTGTST
ncbi:CRE-SRV-1 protein [Aphelenchoides avenae]|nr:CRE-SRV-1 protein [Aphelenchus avenae]